MGYDSKTGIITAPVSVADVSLCLGENSLDVATLCTTGRINPAALFRPRYTSARPDLELNTAGFNYLATQTSNHPTGNYTCPAYGVWVPNLGLNNLSQNNQNAYNALFTAARNTWHIAVPDANSFKCLHHFVGYHHGARVTDPVIHAAVHKVAEGNRITVAMTTPAPDGKTVSVSNLFGGKGWYFGAVVFRGTAASGWMSRDEYLILGSSTAIKGDASTTVELSDIDRGADADAEYTYRVIPFLCNARGVTESGLADKTFLSLRITDGCKPWMEIRGGGMGSGDTGDLLQYFCAKDGNNGSYYPIPGDKSCSYLTPRDIAIAYSEREGTRPLHKKYYRIDIELTCFETRTFETVRETFTWMASGGTDGNGTLRRDDRDGEGAASYGRMLLYIENVNHFGAYQNGLWDVQDVLGKFYYIDDEYGSYMMDSLFATWIPDIDGN